MKRAHVEGVAHIAIGAGGDDLCSVHGFVMHDGGAEIRCAPDAEHGSLDGAEESDVVMRIVALLSESQCSAGERP